MIHLHQVNRNWSLFLDRDGVINYEKREDYIYNYGEFRFYEGVLDAMPIFARNFGKIFIVTNQRGIGKGLMTEKDLEDIHYHMMKAFQDAGCSIDKIYYCTSLDNNHPDRKPNPGMALKAKADFPDIEFSKSVMVGNNLSDMQFGKNAGMHTVFIQTTHPDQELPHPDIDMVFKDLLNFAIALQQARKM